MGLLDWFRVSKATIAPKDIVVFIVGPPGSGKSRLFSILVQIIAKTHVLVDSGQWLGFSQVHAQRCRFKGEESDIVLVDTPSLYTSLIGGGGEEDLKEWLDSNYRKPCKAAGILYMHNIGSNPYVAYVSRHLGHLMSMYHQGLAPNTVHVVPTITPGAKLSTGRIDASMLLLKRQADDVGASMLRTPYDRRPETAWDIVQELLNGMKLGGSLVGGCVSEEMPSRWWGSVGFAREENIALSRTLLEEMAFRWRESLILAQEGNIAHCRTLLEEMPFRWWESLDLAQEGNIALSRTLLEDAPLGHPDHYLALVDLADLLHQRFMREEVKRDLDETITLRRAALELTPCGHQERLVALTNLADSLDRRFWNEGAMEDLMELIPIRRTALELAPPGHQEHRVSLVRLAFCLGQRFGNDGATEDLTEVIALQRAVLKLTPAGHGEHCASLVRLAGCLDLQYFKSGGTLSDLEEIISLQRAVLACGPLSCFDEAMCRGSLTRCLAEKQRRQCVTPSVVDFAPPAYSSPSMRDLIFPHPRRKTSR